MESIWMKPGLANEIINNKGIFDQIHSIVTDIMSGRIDVAQLVENMAGVLTNKEAENREKGMLFFTRLLKELPKDYLDNMQVKFISKFYVDRLKDNHRVIPAVLDGYLVIIDMKNYEVQNAREFFTVLFREVVCQSQLRQDRYNIYSIIAKLLDSELEYNILEALWQQFKFFHNMTWKDQQLAGDMKTLGPDYVYGVISAMDGERDPRNLLFLFSFLPKFISQIPLGHLVDEMFEVISCYYPVDFHPSPDDPDAVTRQELANALMPCLCAIPEFGEHCLVLLIEKLDSSLRLAKMDSLKLLTESCKTFKADSYGPFLKALWSSIHREISNKTDEELKHAAHEALSTLVAKLSITANTDPLFEHFIKGILIAMQTAIAESKTVLQYVQAARVLLTTANASEESCTIITGCMIPATLAFYGFKTSPKLQITSLDFLGNLYDLAKHWNILSSIEKQVNEIPQLCLTAVSQPAKEFQIAGFKTLMRVNDVLDPDLILPFVEVLIHNVQNCQDNDLLTISVETVHVIARKHPELIMSLVVHGRCNLKNLTEEKAALQKRLNLLSNLASIDDFTKIIIKEMLKLITSNDKDASKVVEALSASMSNSSLYNDQQLEKIESDYGLIDSILSWLNTEIELKSPNSLTHGYILVANTIGSLPAEKQQIIISKHGREILEKCGINEVYYLILESLYSSVHNNVFDSSFPDVMSLSLKLALSSKNDSIRTKACGLIAHFLNKAEYGPKLEQLYELLTTYLSSCSKEDQELCPRLILLYGWITKALIMRSSDTFLFWLQKVAVALSCSDFCRQGSEAIRIIMTDFPDYLTSKQHCRISHLYKQRMYQTFSNLTEKPLIPLEEDVKESYLSSWAFVLAKTPKTVLITDIDKIAPLVIESLEYDNKDLLLVMIDVLCHFVQAIHNVVADSLQTILPRLVNLSKYTKSMDVRIKSLQCLYDIANSYRTMLLLPYKQDILLDLAPSLDDNKRLVRNVAVKARTRWFLIGAPGESKEN